MKMSPVNKWPNFTGFRAIWNHWCPPVLGCFHVVRFCRKGVCMQCLFLLHYKKCKCTSDGATLTCSFSLADFWFNWYQLRIDVIFLNPNVTTFSTKCPNHDFHRILISRCLGLYLCVYIRENSNKLFSVQFFPLNRSEMTKATAVDL